MATQGLGGVAEAGMGVGLAQVFPKPKYEVPDIAGALQKGMALKQKKDDAEAKAAKAEKKVEPKESYFHPFDDVMRRRGKEVDKEFREKFAEDPVAASEWLENEKLKMEVLRQNKPDYEKLITKKGEQLATQPGGEIENLEYLEILESGEKLYDVYKNLGNDPNMLLDEIGRMVTAIRKKEPEFSLQEHTRKNLPIIKTQSGINLIQVPDPETGGKKEIAVSDFTKAEADIVAQNIILDPKAYRQINNEYRKDKGVEADVAITNDELSAFYSEKYLYPLVNKYTKQKEIKDSSGGINFTFGGGNKDEKGNPIPENMRQSVNVGYKKPDGENAMVTYDIEMEESYPIDTKGGKVTIIPTNLYNATDGYYDAKPTDVIDFTPTNIGYAKEAGESFNWDDNGITRTYSKGEIVPEQIARAMKADGKKVNKTLVVAGRVREEGSASKEGRDYTAYMPYEGNIKQKMAGAQKLYEGKAKGAGEGKKAETKRQKTIVRKQYNAAQNKTRITYSDDTVEIVDGKQ